MLSCNSGGDSKSMQGAYRMLSQSIRLNGSNQELPGQSQLKIYTADHMMYTNLNLADSVGSFGVATYDLGRKGLSEHLIYSASDSTASTVPQTYDLEIEKTAKGYKQWIMNVTRQDQPTDIFEEYEKVSMDRKSPLDGAWEGLVSYEVRGTDTTMVDIIQYKAYEGGYFMFAHTYVDTVNRLHTGMGYGTFEMNGEQASRETIQASNVGIGNQTFDLSLSFNGPNEYTQSWTAADGSKNIEVYRRMIKD